MLCWQEVRDNLIKLSSTTSPGVVVGASADMVLQPYGAFLAGEPFNQTLLLIENLRCEYQEVQLECSPPSATRQSAGSSFPV